MGFGALMKKTNKTYHYVYRNGTVVDIIVSYDNPRGRSAFRVLSFYVLFLTVIFVGNKVYNVIKELNERIKYADTKEYISPIVPGFRVAEAGESAEIKETIKARASWYGVDDTCGNWYSQGKRCLTADGTEFTGQYGLVACWDDYDFGTVFRVSYGDKTIDVVCHDRGAFRELGRFLDLSENSFKSLAPLSQGVIEVNVEII